MWKPSAAISITKDQNALVKGVRAMLSIAGMGRMDDMLEKNGVLVRRLLENTFTEEI